VAFFIALMRYEPHKKLGVSFPPLLQERRHILQSATRAYRCAFRRFNWTASRSFECLPAHRHKDVTGSKKIRPKAVKSYSTLGGTSAYTVRLSNPPSSNVQSVCVSIFFETSGRYRCNSPYRFVPCPRMYTMIGVHLSPINSSRRRDG
jgi:hypothetical protein